MKTNYFLRHRLVVMLLMLIATMTSAQAGEYITEIISIGTKKGGGNSLKSEYRNQGWIVVDKDLNRNAGGWDVYVAYKTSNTINPETGYITDICASDKQVSSFTFEGRTYYRVPTNSGYNGDLNRDAGGAYIFLYYTRQRDNLQTYGDSKRVITALSTSSDGEDDNPQTAAISWRNSKYSGLCEVNKSAGGDDIYIQQHFTTQKLEWREDPTFATGLVFNGVEQELVKKTASDKNWGTIKFRVDNGAWTADKPMGQDVGNYKIEYYLDGGDFADYSETRSTTVSIDAPIVKAKDLTGVFNQAEKKVNLTWSVGTIPGNYTDYNWVVYRNGEKIAKLPQNVHTYADGSFTNESSPVYDVYYVSKFWDEDTKRDDTKATVTVSTVRTVPINNLEVECQDDRIIFVWTSDGYVAGFGNKFRIYVGDEESPIYTLTPSDMQTSFRWEHRTTDQHTNRQNKIDEQTGVPYTEEPLNACAPSTYRIEGVIGNTTLNSENINPKAIGNGTLFYEFDATKGAYEGMVKLSWHVNKQGSTLTKTYIVERRQAEQEGEPWAVLARMSSTDDYLTYDDQTALPGVFYDYRVTVEDKCSDGSIINNEITSIGFAKSTGTVTGRIAYGSSGTAVQGVEVIMTRTHAGNDDQGQYHSMYFTDVNGSVTWQYPSDAYAASLFASDDFTVQMWLLPESFSDSRIADFGNNIVLGMTVSGQLYFSDGTDNLTFDGITLQTNAYNHVVLTRSGTTLTCYVVNVDADNHPIVKKATQTTTNSPFSTLNSSTQFELGHFKGSVDEFRLWTKCLNEDEILENYDHLLVGNEKNLETYWTFDEGLRTQFFDYSRYGTTYHQHHGRVGSNTTASTVTPGVLTLKAKTDDNGNYQIQGIPFSGEGTTYSVVPLHGIHEFNPSSRLLFFNSNSLVHNNTNFEDVSSFKMSGHIYYAGTNVPADSIQLYIDGVLQSKDGASVQTDEDGYYELSVPIGKHFVEAKMAGHTLADGGRFPTQGTFNFDRHVSHDFSDITLVNFTGRVGGGERNDTLVVGFAASKNNIGMATIQLALNNASFSLNCQDDHISDATSERTWASDTTSINSRSWTGTSYDAKYIYIRTDSLTGEFSALLPPLRYVVKSVRVDNNPNVEFLSLPEINLTNGIQEYTDKIRPEDRDTTLLFGPDTYKYHTKHLFTYFAPPQIDVIDKMNGTTGAFGIQELTDYPIGDAESPETATISDIWKQDDSDGSISYLLGYPLYEKGKTVTYEIFGYEKYTNYDGQEPVHDIIPMNDQEITLTNEMGENQKVIYLVEDSTTGYQVSQIYDIETNKVTLDANGRVTYKWGVGMPNIISPYSRNFSILLVRKDRTYEPFSLNAVVLGDLPEGDNFVTQGPDLVQFVLRDPPGAKSTTTLKRAVVNGTTEMSSDMAIGNHQLLCKNLFGASVTAGAGMGFMYIQQNNVYDQLDVGTHATWRTGDSDEKAWTTTYNQAISTSSAWQYVGSAGDVFVGTATNLLLGKTRNLCIVKDLEGKYGLNVVDALSLGQEVTTLFNYSAYELENVMIPKWKDQRLSYLTEVADQNAAQSYVNTGKRTVYLTWVGKDKNTEYQKNVNYIAVSPQEVDVNEVDSVEWCTNQINSWIKVLRDNEENKVMAMKSREANQSQPWNGWQNFSIDGGSSYSYSVSQDTTKVHKSQTTWSMSAILNNSWANTFKNFVHWGVSSTLSNEVGREQSDIDGVVHKNVMEWDYVLSDGNVDADLSIDKYPSGQAGYSDVFSLFGGQTYNPYEGKEYTKWFEPGQHVLSNGSEQMEQPDIRISVDGMNSAKEATLTDVPAGQAGTYTLFLSNKSNTNRHYNPIFQLIIPDADNTKGLKLSIDGVSFGNGHTILIPQGETVKKVITVNQTDQSVLDYDSVKIVLASNYQPGVIADYVMLHTHFKPSSSPIDLVITEPVLNIENMQRNKGNLEIKLTNFNRQFKGMKKLGVEYRYEGSTTWTQPSGLQFYINKKDSTKQGDQVLPTTGNLRLSYNMSSANDYPQGTYTFRAYTTTMYGEEPVTVYSDEIEVVKDDVAPRQLTTPQPANGILRYGDDIAIEFNEDIVPGYVTDKNIIVTAKLNSQQVLHDVALQLLAAGGTSVSKNPVFLNGDFSIDFWMRWKMAGTILQLGSGQLGLSVDSEGHISAGIAGMEMKSEDVIPKDTWTYVVLSYKAADMAFSALAQYDETTLRLFTNQKVTEGAVMSHVYSNDNRLYMGNMTGAIHDLSLFNIYRDPVEAAATKYQSKDNYVYGLTNYWPMDEGHGTVARDTRHINDIAARYWFRDNKNYALKVDEKGADIDITQINTRPGDSYVLEMWYNSSQRPKDQQELTVFEVGQNQNQRIGLYFTHDYDWVLRYGDKEHLVGNSEAIWDTEWNHVALNVVRGQSASFYFNGQRTAVMAEADIPSLEGAVLSVAKGATSAMVDEVRIWHATLSESHLLNNIYNCIDTTDHYSRGLVAYYPFEKAGTVDGVSTKVETLENLAPRSLGNSVSQGLTIPEGSVYSFNTDVPPVKNAPVESRLIAKPVASERKVIINLTEGSGINARDIEGTTLNITVDKIHDMHGNASEPIRWTAYVQRNTLKWMKDTVNIIKKYGTDYTLDIDIENRGGQTEYYTLMNLPQWLTLEGSERTDDVAPLSTKTLRFRVDPMAAVGDYDVTIGLQGNYEIMEPLRVVMNVREERPSWSVDPSKYENTMNIVGQVYLDGILMSNSESLVAAFVGEECRGVAAPEQTRGAAFVTLTIFGNGATDYNKSLTFRIWDAATGVAYRDANVTLTDGTTVSSILFDADQLIGSFDRPVKWTKSNMMEQRLWLQSKWTWLSLSVTPADSRPLTVFPELTTWNTIIKSRTSDAYCNGVEWYGPLKVEVGNMYKVLLNEQLSYSYDLSDGLTVKGQAVDLSKTPIVLHKGWNWIGYLPTSAMTLREALAGANPKRGDQVKSQTGIAIYGSTGWEGNLKALESGKGYMYYNSSDVEKQFVYPDKTSTTNRKALRHLLRRAPLTVFTPVDPYLYPDNMTVVVQLVDGQAVVDTAEVAAFIAGECRAATKADSGLYYLVIAGEGSGQKMEIQAFIDGDIRVLDDNIVYSSDTNVGTPWQPYVIDLKKANGILPVMGDAKHSEWYDLQGRKIGVQPSRKGVYLRSGNKKVVK